MFLKRLLFLGIGMVLIANAVCAEDMTAQVRLVASSSFIHPEYILANSNGKDHAVLTTPNALNQFLIFDLQKPAAISRIDLVIAADSAVAENDIVCYSGQNILQWQQVTVSVSKAGERYSLQLDPNGAQYVKLVFGSKPRQTPLSVSSLSFLRSDALAAQQITNVRVPEETRAAKSVVIEYETLQPSITYVVYATNFDYVYTNKMDNIYSDVTPKTKHRVMLRGLTSKVTYVYQVLAKDINEKQYQTRSLYFSTR